MPAFRADFTVLASNAPGMKSSRYKRDSATRAG